MPDFLMIHDVVIAGAGPVGLFLACELRLAGLSVLVLEQTEHPHSPLKRLPFGMRGLSAPTIEAFYRRGLLDDMTAPQREKDQSTAAFSSSTTPSTPRRGPIACQVRPVSAWRSRAGSIAVVRQSLKL